MNKFPERMVEALRIGNVDQTQVADAVGSSPQAIQYLCDEGRGSSLTSSIADFCGVRGLWLEKGTGPKLITDSSVKEKQENYPVGTDLAQSLSPTNVSGDNALEKRRVPIMSTKQILDDVPPSRLNDDNHHEWQIPEPGIHIDENTFVIIMAGRSMTNPEHPTNIQPGANIYASSSLEPTSGKVVVVKDIKNESLLIKILENDGPNSYLVSANQQYSPIPLTQDYKIVGVAFAIGTFKHI